MGINYKTDDPPNDPLQFHSGNGKPFKVRSKDEGIGWINLWLLVLKNTRQRIEIIPEMEALKARPKATLSLNGEQADHLAQHIVGA